MNFKCEICNCLAHDKCDYNIYLNTKKHKKSDRCIKNNDMTPIVISYDSVNFI